MDTSLHSGWRVKTLLADLTLPDASVQQVRGSGSRTPASGCEGQRSVYTESGDRVRKAYPVLQPDA